MLGKTEDYAIIDWKKEVIKVTRSMTFYYPWRTYTVNLYSGKRCLMKDMSPTILSRIKLPYLIVRAAEETKKDGKERTIQDNRILITEKPSLITRKPKLIIRRKPQLIVRRKRSE